MPRRPFLVAHEQFALPHFARQHSHHEKCEFCRGFGQHIGGVGEGDFVLVGVGAVDVVKADRDLRHDF